MNAFGTKPAFETPAVHDDDLGPHNQIVNWVEKRLAETRRKHELIPRLFARLRDALATNVRVFRNPNFSAEVVALRGNQIDLRVEQLGTLPWDQCCYGATITLCGDQVTVDFKGTQVTKMFRLQIIDQEVWFTSSGSPGGLELERVTEAILEPILFPQEVVSHQVPHYRRRD